MDEFSVDALLEQHHVAGFGWALSCCSRDQELAEDVLQSVYLKILQGKARYGGQAAFRTWLFSVIRKTAAEERRKNVLRRLGLLKYRQNSMQTPQLDPEEELTERQRLLFGPLQQALAALPRRQQEVLHLVFYQDLTIREAAEVMGVSLGSARVHYERGKTRMGECLRNSEVPNESRS